MGALVYKTNLEQRRRGLPNWLRGILLQMGKLRSNSQKLASMKLGSRGNEGGYVYEEHDVIILVSCIDYLRSPIEVIFAYHV